MEYKYTGKVPAVLLINDALVSISPGEIVEGVGFPASHFNAIIPPLPKKRVAKQKEKTIDAINTDTSSVG